MSKLNLDRSEKPNTWAGILSWSCCNSFTEQKSGLSKRLLCIDWYTRSVHSSRLSNIDWAWTPSAPQVILYEFSIEGVGNVSVSVCLRLSRSLIIAVCSLGSFRCCRNPWMCSAFNKTLPTSIVYMILGVAVFNHRSSLLGAGRSDFWDKEILIEISKSGELRRSCWILVARFIGLKMMLFSLPVRLM